MRELIDKLLDHTTDVNENISDYLVNKIIDNKITSLDELYNCENIIDCEEKLKKAYQKVKKNTYKKDMLDYKTTLEIERLEDKYKELNNKEERIKYIIKMFSILKYEPIFYAQTYTMIINNEL
ncbi:MAG: hypothetical protein GX758_01480 [Tenericutes bacterium]|nr:hypothetical protein [Mycoplasmatota bacterium]